MKRLNVALILLCMIILSLVFVGCGALGAGNETPAKEHIITIATIYNGNVIADKITAESKTLINLTIVANDGYKLVDGSLKYNSTAIDGVSFVMPNYAVTIYAQFERVFNIKVVEYLEGKILCDNLAHCAGETVELSTVAKQGFMFVEESLKYNGIKIVDTTFVMPNEDVVITARFDTVYKLLDDNGKENINGSHILFGEYPQTIATVDEINNMSKTANKNNYYTSGNDRFVKRTADNLKDKDYKFSDGKKIIIGESYFFKVEPIKWKMLYKNNCNVFIVSEIVIDNKEFLSKKNYLLGDNNLYYNGGVDAAISVYANNWQYCDMRKWLGQVLYPTSFCKSQQSIIEATHSDNKSSGYGDENNHYASIQNDTDDNILLMSFQDMINANYGFASNYNDSDTNRCRSASDYARCGGIDMSTSISNYGACRWLLRSPNVTSDSLTTVSYNGQLEVNISNVTNCSLGIVPALTIKLQ